MSDYGGHTRQRKDGRWERVVTLGRHATGRRITKSFYGHTMAEANRKWRDWLATGGAETVERQRTAVTLASFIERWLTETVPGEVTGRTIVSYRYVCDGFILPALGDQQLQDIRPRHVDALLRDVVSKGYSDSVVTRVKSTLGRAMSRAVFEELVEFNPVTAVRRPKGRAATPGRTMTPEQVEAFLAALKESPYCNLFTVQLGTGMRPGEAAGLCWDAVDFERSIIQVRRFVRLHPEIDANGKQHTTLVLVDDVKNHKPRTIKASVLVMDALRAQHKALRLRDGVIHPVGELVFPGPDGKLAHPSWGNYGRHLKAVCVAAGLPDAETWHANELRHTFVSLMSEQGLSPEKIADYVGHSPEIDRGVYRHQIRKVVDLGDHVEGIG